MRRRRPSRDTHEVVCDVCGDRRIVRVVADHSLRTPLLVRCPHCNPPYLPISTYHHREQS